MSAFNILFIDIETIAKEEIFAHLDERTQKIFLKKFKDRRKDIIDSPGKGKIKTRKETDQELWVSNAGLHAEFNKIIVVCIGVIVPSKTEGLQDSIYIKTIKGTNEEALLVEVSNAIGKNSSYSVCGHNGIGFDFPVLGRKFLMYGMTLPSVLNVTNLKPWEMRWLDTQKMWAFGDFKATVSLDNLANSFGLESPKDILNDYSVHQIFYNQTILETNRKTPLTQDERLQHLGKYCAGDVLTLIQVYLRITGELFIPKENVKIV